MIVLIINNFTNIYNAYELASFIVVHSSYHNFFVIKRIKYYLSMTRACIYLYTLYAHKLYALFGSR